jgi:hypothetical protein
MMRINVGVYFPIPAAQDFQLFQNRNNGRIEIENNIFAEHIEGDDLHVVRLTQGASPTKRQPVDRLLGCRYAAGFHAVEKPVLLHPRNQLIGVIRLLDGMFGKDRLVAVVVAQRRAQAQRLGEFSRLMNELVDPLQVIRPFSARECFDKGPCRSCERYSSE